MYIKLSSLIFGLFFTSLFANNICLGAGELPKSLPQRNPFLPISQQQYQQSFYTPLVNSGFPKNSLTVQQEIPSLHKYKLSYVKAEEIKEALQTLCQAGKVTAEPLSNSILYLGTNKEALTLSTAIQSIDKATSQITLQAKVISVSHDESKNLGINWSWDIIPQHKNSNSDSSNSSSSTTTNNKYGKLSFGRGYSFKFGATLNALFAKGNAKILASPHIITLPGKEGKIFIGDRIPFEIEKHDSSGNYSSTEYINAGIKLQYTPILNEKEDLITAAVQTEVSTPVLVSELKNYKVTSRSAETTVRMKSGETLVIGGLITAEEQKTLQKLPFLGDLPILGNLFRNRTHTKNKTEILLLLTPYISKAGEAPIIFKEQGDKLGKGKLSGNN